MSGEETSYIAFISYRHAEVDTAVARDVQRGLERFHVPRALREEGAPDRLAPVFRDKEELPVSAAIGDDIAHALAHTESLVVVCSPRTRESSWVRREIDMFLQTHDRSRVFTVLAEGEPADIIPEQLLSETVDGVERPLEPLSCDFRTTRREDRHTELVRLAAAILGVSFDSLMQRDRRRRTRIATALFCTILAVVAGIAGFALWSNARIQEHYDEAVANHARLLATEAQQQLEGGDRLAAIELATAAMPQKGEGRSASPDATHVLQQATGAYERLAGSHHPSSLCMVARRALGQGVRHLCSSPNGAYVGAMGEHGLVRVWDADSMEQLLETQVLDPVLSGFVITDDGRVVVGCQKRVACWDLQSKECCWDVDMYERTNGLYGATTYHLVLSDDQKHAYALGRGLACSIDVTSGESAAEVSYGPGSDDGLNFVGGDTNAGDIVADCADNVCVVSMTYIDKQTSKAYDTLCSLDFAAGTCTILPTRYGAIRGIRLLDRTSVVMSYGDDRPHVDRYRNPNGVVGQEQRLRHVTRRDLRSDEVAWQRDITFWSPAWYESLCPISNLKAAFLEEGDARQVLAYSVANVCEVIDPDTGASLGHYEAPLPFVAVWPHVSEGRVTGMYGCLSKGKTFANYFSNGLCSSLDGQCVDAELGIRVGERAILANAEGALYVYESPRKDDAITMLEQMAVAKAIPTQHGILVVGVPEESESGQKSVRLRMVDCAGKRVKWERTIAGNETESAKPMSHDEGCSELYMRLFVKDDEVDMATVDLATGEVQDWKATSNASKAGEGMPYVPIVGSYSGRIVTDMAYGVDRKGVVVTDLHERTTRTIWPEGLDNEMSSFSAAPISPDQSLVLVPLLVRDSEKTGLVRYALVNNAGKIVGRLERPLSEDVSLSWSDDGSVFAGVCDDAVVVWDTMGNERFSVPLEGRVILGLRILGDRLLVACNEQGSLALFSYALDGSGSVLHATLRTSEGFVSKLLGEEVQWVPSTQGRDPSRDPGDLCVVFPSDYSAYLIDTATLTVCQELYDCYGYDAASGCFLVRTNDVEETSDTAYLGIFERYTVDDLVERGASQVGASTLDEVQRKEFGL